MQVFNQLSQRQLCYFSQISLLKLPIQAEMKQNHAQGLYLQWARLGDKVGNPFWPEMGIFNYATLASLRLKLKLSIYCIGIAGQNSDLAVTTLNPLKSLLIIQTMKDMAKINFPLLLPIMNRMDWLGK